jgi:hypothetical protein
MLMKSWPRRVLTIGLNAGRLVLGRSSSPKLQALVCDRVVWPPIACQPPSIVQILPACRTTVLVQGSLAETASAILGTRSTYMTTTVTQVVFFLCRIRPFFRYTFLLSPFSLILHSFPFYGPAIPPLYQVCIYTFTAFANNSLSFATRKLKMRRGFRHLLVATALLGTTNGQGNSLLRGIFHPISSANVLEDLGGKSSHDVGIGKSKTPSNTNPRSAGLAVTRLDHNVVDITSPLVDRADDPMGGLVNTLGATSNLLNVTLNTVSDVLTNATLSLVTVCFWPHHKKND